MPARTSDDSPFLTAEEAAKFLHTTPSTLRQTVIPKRIPHRRSGHKLLFVAEELDRWLKLQTRIELARIADKQRRRDVAARRRHRKKKKPNGHI